MAVKENKTSEVPYKEHPTLGYVLNDSSGLISGIDAFAIRNLQANPEDASKWLESKYPDLEFTVDGGEIYTKPKGQIAWEPVNTELLGVSPVSESDVLEMAVSAPATFGGPAAQAAVAAGFDQARQQIANLMGVQEGISPGRTAAVSALAAAAPFVGAAGVRGATKLGAKLSKNVPESVWNKYAQNYDELRGLVKASADEALPQLERISQRVGSGFSSAWDQLSQNYRNLIQKAASEVGEVPTDALIASLEKRRAEGMVAPGASRVAPLTKQGASLVREFQKALGSEKLVPLADTQGRLELGKASVKIPQTRKVSEKQAASFWEKVKPELVDPLKMDMQLAGIDPTTNILKLTEGTVVREIEVPVSKILEPKATGAQLAQTLEAFKGRPSFQDEGYSTEAARILSSGMGGVKDLLKQSAKPETQQELGRAASQFANMEQIKDVLFGAQRSQSIDDITDLVGTKVDAPKVAQALRGVFGGSEDAALLKQKQLLDASSPAMRPQLEKDLAAIAMRNVGSGAVSGGGLAGSLGAAAGFGTAGPVGAAMGGGMGAITGGIIGGPKFTRDVLIPAALLAEKAVGPKSSAWSRVPIIEATKSLQKGKASKTKED